MLIFRHATLVLPDVLVQDRCVVVDGARVQRVCDDTDAPTDPGATVLDLRGDLLAPGLVDLHCHGGAAFNAFEHPCEFMAHHLRGGTTSVLPTLGYNQMPPVMITERLRHFVHEAQGAANDTSVGFHLEGPYMNPRYGANSDRSPMRPPDPDEYEPLIREFGEHIRLWSFAPELDGADTFIRCAAAAGIILSVGHSEASAARFEQVAAMGVRQACHALNATGLTPPPASRGVRQPGLDEAVMLADNVLAELIADREGRHVDPRFLRLMLRAKGPDRIALITDCTTSASPHTASAAADVHYNERGELSGSRLTMGQAVRNMHLHTGCSLPEAFRMGALNPARALGMDHELGSVAEGKRANLLVMGQTLALKRVFLEGREVAL